MRNKLKINHHSLSKSAVAARIGVLVLLTTVCSAAAWASEYGLVISSKPVLSDVNTPYQECTDEQRWVQPRTSGGGALVGALIGGAIGNNFGNGMGRAAATGLGAVAGAAIGDQTEAMNAPLESTSMRRCQTVAHHERRIVGYDVVYEYKGQRHQARLAQEPGPRIALDVTVAPTSGVLASAQPYPTYAPLPPQQIEEPVYAPRRVLYAPAPAYRYYDYGGPSFVVVPRLVIGGHWHHGHHRHHRHRRH